MIKQEELCTSNCVLVSFKREEILIHATIWTNLKDIMQNEISQSQVLCDSLHVRYLRWKVPRDRKQ